MKFKLSFLVLLLALNVMGYSKKAHASLDEEELPSEESIIATNTTPSNPPVIIDETDAEDVSDVDEYDN